MCFLILSFFYFKALPSAHASFLLMTGSILQMNGRILLIITFITTLLKHLVNIYKTSSFLKNIIFYLLFLTNTLLFVMCYEMVVYVICYKDSDMYRTFDVIA